VGEVHKVTVKLCRPDRAEIAEIAMIHGDADESASVVDARRFAQQLGARLTEVKGAAHRIMIPGGLDLTCNIQLISKSNFHS